jgi:hypothetical protein
MLYHFSGHVAMTYTAVASLVILGDDLSRIDRNHITSGKKPSTRIASISLIHTSGKKP